jgi:hypothetical protein
MADDSFCTGCSLFSYPLLECSRQHHTPKQNSLRAGIWNRWFANIWMDFVYRGIDDFLKVNCGIPQAGTGDKRIDHESTKGRKHEEEIISCFLFRDVVVIEKLI